MKSKQEEDLQDDLLVQQSSTYMKLVEKYNTVSEGVFNIFNYVLDQKPTLEDLDISAQIELRDMSEEKYLMENPQILINNLDKMVKKIMQMTTQALQNINKRIDGKYESYDKIQKRLEKDILDNQKSQQLLKIKLECLAIKNNNFKDIYNQNDKDQQQQKIIIQNLKKEIDQLTKERHKESIELKSLRETVKSQKRKMENMEISSRRTSNIKNFSVQRDNFTSNSSQPLVNIQPQTAPNRSSLVNGSQTNLPNGSFYNGNSQQQFQEQQFSEKKTVGITIPGQEQLQLSKSQSFFPYTVKQDQFNLLKNSMQSLKSQEFGKIDRKQQNLVFQANRQKQTQSEKYGYELNRLEIQLKNKEKENKKLEKMAEEFQKELKKLREEMLEEDKKKWAVEINSEKNPNLLDYFKGQIDSKNKQIKQVQKSQRKFAIQEKKLIVKEKAFEHERSDYHGTVLKQAQRIEILMNIKQITREQLDLLIKLDDLEKKGLTIKQIQLVVDYLHRKGVTVRDFQNIMEDDLGGRVDQYKQYQKLKEQVKMQQEEQFQD